MFERPQINRDESVWNAPREATLDGGQLRSSDEQRCGKSRRNFDVNTLPGLQTLWAETLGHPDVMIAVLDGPVDLSHACFRGATISAPQSLGDTPFAPLAVDPLDAKRAAAEHGTHVASVIFAQHGCGMSGVAPRCRGVSLPVFHRRAGGSLAPCSQVDLARAITGAVQLADEAGARALVINISGGQLADSGQAHPLLADCIRHCDPQRVLIVAAAGNQGCDCLHIPGAVPSVLVVGAMSADGAPLEFSNWGSAYRSQGILAPGENIVGAQPGGGIVARTGTSFATPVAAGVAALLLSWQIAHGRAPDAGQARSALLQSAIGCDRQPADDCRRLLGGRMAIERAMALLAEPSVNAQSPATLQAPSGANAFPSETEPSLSPGEYAMSQAAHSASQASPEAEAREALIGSFQSPQALRHSVAPAACASNSTADALVANNMLDGPVESAAVSVVEAQNTSAVSPADCGCGGKCGGAGKAPPVLQKVFALGRLSFDYGTRARRQYFLNEMRKTLGNEFRGVDDPVTLYNYLTRVDKPERRYTILDEHRFTSRAEVTALNWVLNMNDTPVYAIVPLGAFAHEIHDLLVSFLNDQLTDGAERVSLPGVIIGQATLFTGEVVPIVQPDIRGMFSWKTSALVDLIQKQAKGDRAADTPLLDFLNRVYSQTHNLGLTSQDRAINFAATDALMNAGIFRKIRKDHAELEFDSFSVERSPICRADADCWDVVLYFYDPTNLMRARRAIRYTIDVADVVPIIVGEQREYSVR
jgi:cyanobactin maturation PatA/PatG family protease